MLKKSAVVAAFLYGFLAAGLASAAEKATSELTREEFQQRKAQIEAEMEPGERYAGLGNAKKTELRELLARMDSRLSGHASSRELPADEQVRLFNEQERVNTLLAVNTESERVVCRRDRKTGSNRITTVCRTQGEIEEERERTLQDLRRVRTGIGAPNG